MDLEGIILCRFPFNRLSAKSKVEVTLCQRTPRLPASLPLITFPFYTLVVSLTPHPALKRLSRNFLI